MVTSFAEFQVDLSRICQKLRYAGLSDAIIKSFEEQWLRAASVAELQEAVAELESLEKRIGSGEDQTSKVLSEYMGLMDRLGQITERPEMLAVFAAGETSPRYPHVKVSLADLDGQLWPILRRVSYAMSDADVDNAEIDRYKDEMKSSCDPVGVCRQWVSIL